MKNKLKLIIPVLAAAILATNCPGKKSAHIG